MLSGRMGKKFKSGSGAGVPIPAPLDDEVDFPRGGSDIPAFASKGKRGKELGKKRKHGDKLAEDTGDELESPFGLASKGKLPKSVQVLRYKNLSVGMKVLGTVTDVRRKDLVVSLPGGLRGFVPASESTDVTSATESAGFVSEENLSGVVPGLNSRTNHETAVNSASWRTLFHLGQLVSCTVIKLESGKSRKLKKDSKRIELSLRLSHLHKGFNIQSLHEGLPLTAYVSSVEDHGYGLRIGVDSVTGFLLHRDFEGGEKAKLLPGQLLHGVVSHVNVKQKSFVLKESGKTLTASMVKEHEGVSLDSLVPGSLVEARVRAVVSSGLLLSFLTFFTGTVDLFHLEDPLPRPEWGQKYSANQRLKARILYVDPSTKSVALSLNKHLVGGGAPLVPMIVGEIFENACVRRIDHSVGLLLELPSKSKAIAAYSHISHASDEHIDKLESSFKVGKTVRARVIGMRALDGLLTVSLKESVVKQPLLRFSDVKAGLVVQGRITAVEGTGLSVSLAEGIEAFCPTGHLSEFEGLAPSEKFRVGAVLKFRVLVCPPVSRKITLTHKQTLVTSKLAVITRYEDALEGLVTHGWISRVDEYGCVVTFYNNVKALAHKTELGLDLLTPIRTVYKVGQVMRCRVLRANAVERQMLVSFNFSSSRNKHVSDATAAFMDITPGNIVSGVVKEVGEEMIILEVESVKGPVPGVMEFNHLSDTPAHVDQLKAGLKSGYRFDRLLVLDVLWQKVVLSSKFSLLQAAPTLPSSISELAVQAIIPGYVASVTSFGVFVRFLSRLTGLAVNPHISDTVIENPASSYSVGQSVSACILEVDREADKFLVSLKQSICFSRDVSLIEGYFLEEHRIAELRTPDHLERMKDIQIGSVVEGRVLQVREYGVVVSLDDHPGVVGFVTLHQVSDVMEVGKKVRARVLDLAKLDGVVDLTLRPELLNESNKLEMGRKKQGHALVAPTLTVSETVNASVELVKDDYLVLSLPGHSNQIAFAATRDFNFQLLNPHQQYSQGRAVSGTVCSLQASGRVLILLSRLSESPVVLSTKKTRKDGRYRTGSLVKGQISAIDPSFLVLNIDNGVQGRVHITEVQDEFEEGCPFDRFCIGQAVTAKVLAKVRVSKSAGKNVLLELSVKPSQVSDGNNKSGMDDRSKTSDEPDSTDKLDASEEVDTNGETRALDSSLGLPTLDVFKEGETITAFVQEINSQWAWLIVNRHIRGRLFVLDSSATPKDLETFTERFQIGHAVRCRILGVNFGHGTLDLTLRGMDTQQVDWIPLVRVGDVVGGRISQVFPGAGGLAVQIGAHRYGRVHVTDMLDTWEDDPGKHFTVGQFVQCTVVAVTNSSGGSGQVDLSLTADPKRVGISAGKSVMTSIDSRNLTPGLKVQGYIKTISERGCFVALARHVDAKIMLCNLSDSFVKDPLQEFPPGKVVRGRLLQIDSASGLVSMTLKNEHEIEGPATFEELHVGDTVVGIVRRMETFGIFITLQPSKLVGMCHISEVPEHNAEKQQYGVGERVVVKVLKVDTKTKRISLGMKASHVLAEGDTTVQRPIYHKLEDVLQSNRVDVGKSHRDIPADTYLAKASRPDLTLSSVPHLEVVFDTDEDAAEDIQQDHKHSKSQEQDVAVTELPKVSFQETKSKGTETAAPVGFPAQYGATSPQTAEEFEGLLAISPSSSFLWIKYMAFMLSISEIEKARGIAERAIQTINFREEVEKRNIWVAYLNLEYEFGSPSVEAVDKVFQRAITFNDPKKMYFALFNLHERHKQHDRSDQVLKTMTRKYNTSAKVWIRQFQTTLERGSETLRSTVFDRALLSLPKRKHLKFISQAAILEFKSGSPDRARAIFEGVLRNYPKRLDLWHHYLDQEIRLGDASLIRALFERVTCLDIAAKKMKFVFKRFLDYEKSSGDEDRVDYVKQKAMAYVESVAG